MKLTHSNIHTLDVSLIASHHSLGFKNFLYQLSVAGLFVSAPKVIKNQ
jgi:hypothetical protein